MTVYNRCLVARRRTTTTSTATIITTVAARKDLIFRPRIDIGLSGGPRRGRKKGRESGAVYHREKKNNNGAFITRN